MSSDVLTRLTEAEKSFKKACEQILQLNRRLDDMAKRYDKASRENHRSFRYSLRLRMAVTEGVRNMYYEYAANKADEITSLRCQVGGVEQDVDANNRQAPANNTGAGGARSSLAAEVQAAEVDDDNHMSDLDNLDNREEHDDPADAAQPEEDNADEGGMVVGEDDWVMVNVDSHDGESSTGDLTVPNLSVPNLVDSESDVDSHTHSGNENHQQGEECIDAEGAQTQGAETDVESTGSSGVQASRLFGRLMPFSTSNLPSRDSASSSPTMTYSQS